MRIENVDFEQFARITKEENRQIIVWGIGTFFKTCITQLLKEYDLEKHVDVLIDGDEKKWKESIILNGRELMIQSPDILRGKKEKHELLITSSYFAGIVDWVDSIETGRQMRCFIAPLMFPNQQ